MRCTRAGDGLAVPPASLPAIFLVTVLIDFVRPLLAYADVVCLDVGQLRQLGAQLGKLQPRDLFIEMLRQYLDTDRILRRVAE